MAVSFISLGFRIFTRLRSLKRLFIDDALVVFAWLVGLGTAIAQQLNSDIMFKLIEVGIGNAELDPSASEKLKTFPLKVAIIMLLFYTSLWSVKLSFLFLFRRLVAKVAGHKVLWWTIFVVTAATYVVTIAATRWPCVVASSAEKEQECSSPQATKFSEDVLRAIGALDILTDYMSKLTFWRKRLASLGLEHAAAKNVHQSWPSLSTYCGK